MNKIIKKWTLKQLASRLHHAYPLIAGIIIVLILSPAQIKTAYDPNFQKPAYVADATHTAATKKLFAATLEGNVDLALEAIKERADINGVNAKEKTPLMIAVHNGHVQITDLLLKHKANINFENQDGHKALQEAVSNGHTDTVRLLLNHNANPHTALIMASSKGYTDTVRLLIYLTPQVTNIEAQH